MNAENGGKLLITLLFIGIILCLRWLLRRITTAAPFRGSTQRAFWVRQAISLTIAVMLLLGIASIWFDDPTRLTTALGLITAGLAFALQKVVSSIAGYFVILRGKTFNVGDRIVMGGVRGDVIALGFTQTTIMEMGQPPGVQSDEPAMWVKSRQYTGRIVTVPNSKVFDEPIYNYTRDFDLIWEELSLPIAYTADRKVAEEILLGAAEKQQVHPTNLSATELKELSRRYDVLDLNDFGPRVYQRLTDNWLELSVRWLTRSRGVREVKDSMTREILPALERRGISIASTTFAVVDLPPLRIERPQSETVAEKHDSS
jgi:small-conductance mechanosensitive channel